MAGRIESGRDYACLTVADTGGGMDPPTMARIFEPFFTTKERGHGTGLGLAMVHGTVTSYGGALTVESTPSVGSIFAVYLPLVSAEPDTKARSATVAGEIRGHERILVVDDESDLADMLAIGLERLDRKSVV